MEAFNLTPEEWDSIVMDGVPSPMDTTGFACINYDTILKPKEKKSHGCILNYLSGNSLLLGILSVKD